MVFMYFIVNKEKNIFYRAFEGNNESKKTLKDVVKRKVHNFSFFFDEKSVGKLVCFRFSQIEVFPPIFVLEENRENRLQRTL